MLTPVKSTQTGDIGHHLHRFTNLSRHAASGPCFFTPLIIEQQQIDELLDSFARAR